MSCVKRIDWKKRAKEARLTNQIIATALGYSNAAKVSQAWSWERVPSAIRLFIVIAERVSPKDLDAIMRELSKDPAPPPRRGGR